jgi:glutathione S-transferase
MTRPTLTIASKNYGAWSLRGWLLCKLAGLDFDEVHQDAEDPATRAELLLLASSFRVPALRIDGADIWDTIALAEELNERFPEAGLLPGDPAKRAHCRSICGEMHSGFANLRSALPMNIRARYEHFPVWSAARTDIARIREIWQECLEASGGPYLFGDHPTMADAMYAPVCTRFVTYGVEMNGILAKYCSTILGMPAMCEWIEAAEGEPNSIEELDAEF